ncbi:DUF3231 family protein [Bacillus shivajii]|uniref:DUF3231 family protein n=1 Tax=Bacillus shivajii TaxID=1983719 RepID=UPI001CF96694|nr:DUF3231 family protein [Bacillus shivajii]UCZ53494.1 DUF3231 family protein [Bacillus shivajii]
MVEIRFHCRWWLRERSHGFSYPDKVRFVTKKNFLAGFTSKRRPLLAQEITHLFTNLDGNTLGKTLMIAFAQVADSKEVRSLIWRGKGIAEKHIKLFSQKLIEDHLPTPSPWDAGVTKSQESPFSDKLIINFITFLCASSIGNYGLAMGTSPRHDLGFLFARLSMEIASYTEDLADFNIEQGWMEEPPQAADRENLADI